MSSAAASAEAHILAEFSLPSEPAAERKAMEQVAAVVEPLNLPPARFERLKTAVAETALNAIEHGNRYQPELRVFISVLVRGNDLIVRVADSSGGRPLPAYTTPDLDAKLAGEQSPRGWGLFLIKSMVDEMTTHSDETGHTVELILHLDPPASKTNPLAPSPGES